MGHVSGGRAGGVRPPRSPNVAFAFVTNTWLGCARMLVVLARARARARACASAYVRVQPQPFPLCVVAIVPTHTGHDLGQGSGDYG